MNKWQAALLGLKQLLHETERFRVRRFGKSGLAQFQGARQHHQGDEQRFQPAAVQRRLTR